METLGNFLDAATRADGAHDQPDGQRDGNTENQDDDGHPVHKLPIFQQLCSLMPRSVRPLAGSWQAAMPWCNPSHPISFSSGDDNPPPRVRVN